MVVFDCVVGLHRRCCRHIHGCQRDTDGIVEGDIVGTLLLYPYNKVEVNRCRGNREVGRDTEGVAHLAVGSHACGDGVGTGLQCQCLSCILGIASNPIVQDYLVGRRSTAV